MTWLRGRRVFITGGEGFVGSNIAERCVEAGAHVTSFDARLPGTGYHPNNLDGLAVSRIVGDLRDPAALDAAITGHDVIFHCAATTSHKRSMSAPLENLAINAGGTLELLEALRRQAPDARLIHIGTTTQLGPHRVQPADEDHPQAPIDLYSAHKMLAERTVLIYARSHGIRASVVRLPNLYGPRICLTDPGLSFIGWFIGLGLRGAPLTVYRPGTQRRNFLYIGDAVDGLLKVAHDAELIGRSLTLGHLDHHAVIDAAHAVARHIGGEARLIDWPADRKAIEVGDVLLDTARSRALIDWSPAHDLDHGMALTAARIRRTQTSEAR